MENNIVDAQYHTSWDMGDHHFQSTCKYDKQGNNVFDVVSVDVDGIDLYYCDEEYIVLPDGSRIDRADFLLEGVADGEEDSISAEDADKLKKLFPKAIYQCGSCENTFHKPKDNECPHCGSGNFVQGHIDD